VRRHIKRVSARDPAKVGSVPQYGLCLEEIDELVMAIFEVGNRNLKVFLKFMKPEANQFLSQDNRQRAGVRFESGMVWY
jgi:hypothetical protein